MYSAAGLAAGEGFFGWFSDVLEGHGEVGDAVGHLVGLPVGFAIFVGAMVAALRPGRRAAVAWFSLTALLATAAYVVGFVVAGPPVDFAASIAAAGVVSGLIQARTLRHRGVPGGGSSLAAAVLGYALGGVAGLAVVIPIAPHLPEGALWYALTTGILGAVAGAVGGAVDGYILSRVWWTSGRLAHALAQ